ncbi:hypothetical protein CLOM_g8517 [Closterium sp. NIES-68]|nr:hypothetical protein CLOM_g8517 [Closterium sp. NIES-68]GJP73736.1 hypothetical protein CLOP_g4424 [Closterium sp. NIES-67]GJP83780.1 hypothetical protein CLOP_g13890 [Closterium sp. NIES-67]
MEGTARSGPDFDLVSFVRGVQAEWESGRLKSQWREHLARHVDGLRRHVPHFPLPSITRQARADPASADGGERPPGLRDVGVRAIGAQPGGGQGGGAEGADSRGDENGAEGRRNGGGAPLGAVAQAAQAESRRVRKASGRKWGRETVKQRMERWRREREMMMRAAEEEGEEEEETPQAVAVEELYVARTRHYTPNVLTFGYSFKQWTEYWALLTTGELYLGLPHGDPRHFDFHADRRTNPHRFVPLSHAHGPSHEFEYDGCQVALSPGQQEVRLGNDVVFKRVQPCEAEDGCRLDGRFVHEAARDFVDAAEASGVKGVTTVSFRPDGTFSVRGGTGILPCKSGGRGGGEGVGVGMGMGNGEREGQVDDEDRGGRGEYEIRGNGIELRYEGGRVEDAFFFEYPGSEGTEVNINGTTYHRVAEHGGEE